MRKGFSAETKSAAAELETKTGTAELGFVLKSVNVAQRIIEGYASTSDLDSYGDVVEAKACQFEDPSDVGVYVGHDWRLGALPVGIPVEIKYEGDRLFTRTLIHRTHAGDDLLAVAAERAALGKPLGISIGYPTDSVKATFERKSGGRLVRRISSLQLREFSFTPIPVNDHAVVTAVKARTDDADPGDEWEEKATALLDELATETKAGRVLADRNVALLQQIHDRAHTMATNAGHDLHGHGAQEHDHADGDENQTLADQQQAADTAADDDSNEDEDKAMTFAPDIAIALLDLDLAETSTKYAGRA